MKILAFSDPHLLWENPVCRKDDLVEKQWSKFSYIYSVAYDEQAIVCIAGDLTNGPRSWQLLPDLTNFFRSTREWEPPVTTLVVRGQHDLYMRNMAHKDRTIMGTLSRGGLVEELGDVPLIDSKVASLRGDVHFYGCNYGETVPTPIDEEVTNVLLIHDSIADKKLWAAQDSKDATRFLEEHKLFDLIIAGDIHRHYAIRDGQLRNSRWIVNTGPMLRKDADTYSWEHKPHFYIYDTEEIKLVRYEIPHDPPNKVLTRSHIEKAELVRYDKDKLQAFIDRVKLTRKKGYKSGKFQDNLILLASESKATNEVRGLLREVTGCQIPKGA